MALSLLLVHTHVYGAHAHHLKGMNDMAKEWSMTHPEQGARTIADIACLKKPKGKPYHPTCPSSLLASN